MVGSFLHQSALSIFFWSESFFPLDGRRDSARRRSHRDRKVDRKPRSGIGEMAELFFTFPFHFYSMIKPKLTTSPQPSNPSSSLQPREEQLKSFLSSRGLKEPRLTESVKYLISIDMDIPKIRSGAVTEDIKKIQIPRDVRSMLYSLCPGHPNPPLSASDGEMPTPPAHGGRHYEPPKQHSFMVSNFKVGAQMRLSAPVTTNNLFDDVFELIGWDCKRRGINVFTDGMEYWKVLLCVIMSVWIILLF